MPLRLRVYIQGRYTLTDLKSVDNGDLRTCDKLERVSAASSLGHERHRDNLCNIMSTSLSFVQCSIRPPLVSREALEHWEKVFLFAI